MNVNGKCEFIHLIAISFYFIYSINSKQMRSEIPFENVFNFPHLVGMLDRLSRCRSINRIHLCNWPNFLIPLRSFDAGGMANDGTHVRLMRAILAGRFPGSMSRWRRCIFRHQ